ncbi:MAG: hypothetical protein AAAFM81_10255 [Pseudomonadota bacterium]
MIWRNKHVVVAMLVAPVLAIMAWFAVDRLVGEQPHAAIEGAAYPLIPQPVCRYASGQCLLKNGDFELVIEPTRRRGSLFLRPKHPISAAVVSRSSDGLTFDPEVPFTPDGSSSTLWRGSLGATLSRTDTLRIAVSASGATYYAEITMMFID